MRTFLTLVLVCFLYSARAATYYFSTSSGDDSRSSTQAKSSSTPWKTISKLNSFFSNLQPGDQVLFKRGETFYGLITVNKSGTASSPIVIGAYGTGNRPIITSLVTLSGWTANSTYKGVYECNANSAFGERVNIVLLNDAQKAMGRYPNSNAPNKGYLTLESHSNKTSITDKELTSSPNWKDAELVLRTCHWVIERCKITSHSGSTIYYTANEGAYAPRDKYGYFIQNSIKTLDQTGEWYYNPSTKKISMFFGSNSPSSYTVKASTIDNIVYSSGKSYIVFDNLTLKGANENGVYISSGSNINIKNCDVLYSGMTGVQASNHAYFKLENSTVLNSNNNGVSASSSYAVIRNNLIKNSFSIAGMGRSGQGQGAGIKIGTTGLAEYNQVINSGFFGITFWGDNAVIKNNYIDTFCFIKDDGAGIYASNGTNVTFKGRKVTGNVVLNGIGAPEGANTTASSADGIYMDDDVNAVEITGNTIANSNRGLYLHNTRYIVVRNNTSFNNKFGQLHMKYDGLGGLLRNSTITNNIFFSKYEDDAASVIFTKKDDYDIASMGRFDSNYYARPMDNTNLILTTTYVYTSSQVRTYRDLPEWKSKYNKDPLSKLSLKTIADNPDYYIKFVYNSTQVNKTVSLNGTYVDAKNNKYSNSIELKPYTSAVLIKDGTTTSVVKAAPAVSITSPAVNSSYKAPATINMAAAATDADGTISKVQFYNGTTLLRTENYSPYTYSWNNVPTGTYSLTAKATDNDGNVTTSAIVKVSVVSSTGNTAPTVSITTPVTNTSYTAPATINMVAAATDKDGTISKVQFYNGSNLLHTEYYGTYSYSWSNVPAGTYTITAKATDNDGATTTSAGVKVTVVSKSSRPSNNNEASIVINNSDTAKLQGATSLKNIDFKLYPVPALSSIHLNFDRFLINQRATLTIQNVSGIILKRYPVVISGKTLEIDISSLNSGMFIISLATDEVSLNKKFLKIN